MTDVLAGVFAPWAIYATILVLHLALPARWIDGYVRDESTGAPLRYRLNGLLVFAVVMGLAWLIGMAEWLPSDWLWTHRRSGLFGAWILGLAFTAAIVLPAPSVQRSLAVDLFLGRRLNPRLPSGALDAKMALYLLGATMLGLNLLSFAAHHVKTFPNDPSPGVLIHVALFGWFLVDYLLFERVHLYTYDLFAERVGFKLGWGCLVFYPYFYAVGLWSVCERPNPERSTGWFVVATVLFFAGWCLSRGANLQKFWFKLDPNRPFLGVLPPAAVRDGERALLCSGFWGISRHVNYLGEILMATGLALSLGLPFALGPWLYPLYYVALLLPRERDDDRRCAAKYGALWQEYCRRVPWRIVPKVY